MRKEELDRILEQRPFQPFRVYLSTGVFFDIQKPHFATATKTTLNLSFPLESDKQRFINIALIHIVWLEMLVPTPE